MVKTRYISMIWWWW